MQPSLLAWVTDFHNNLTQPVEQQPEDSLPLRQAKSTIHASKHYREQGLELTFYLVASGTGQVAGYSGKKTATPCNLLYAI